MKKIYLFIALTLMSLLTFADDIPFRNQRRELFAALPTDTNSIVFLGNSITNFNNWSEAFSSDPRVVNRGISGIESKEVLDHLDLIVSGQPAKLFLMIGINDYQHAADVVPNVKKMIAYVREHSPRTTMYVQSILPCNLDVRKGMVVPTNKDLKALCESEGVAFVDVYGMVAQNGLLPSAHTNDNLHLMASGFRLWCKGIEDLVGIPCTLTQTANASPYGNAHFNQRASVINALPVNEGDVLMVGDYLSAFGEWAELMGSGKVKNHGIGIGWGYTPTISQLTQLVPYAVKGKPASVFLEVGTKDIVGNMTAKTTAIADYKKLLAAVSKAAPDATIYIQSLFPDASSDLNVKYVVPFNAALKELADEDTTDKIEYVDLFTPFAANYALAPEFVSANTEQSRGINGKAYVRWANLISPYMEGVTPRKEVKDIATLEKELVLLPRPQQLTLTGGWYSGDETVTEVTADKSVGENDYDLYGYPDEAYRLQITEDAITVTATNKVGFLRARQTMAQLKESTDGQLPTCDIVDWPAFKLRGYMHDVGRSFISIDELKKEIDLLARFKVNTFHWHFTENQAWRLEINAYPQLTAAKNMTRFAGQYYTQQQCRDLEAYAAERGIIIIPEIDMPGHSGAFERAMGHGMLTTQGQKELKTILGEVLDIFPLAPYIHIGADETAVSEDFLNAMADVVHKGGKKVVTWDPINTTIKSTFCDMTQLWSSRGTAVDGIPAIDCRYNYLNHFDVFADVVGIYKSTIYYATEGNPGIAGAITATWNDRKTPDETDIVRQNNIYANILATTERAWCGGGKRYIEQGGTRLPNTGEEYDEFADWERRFLFHKNHSLKDEPIPYVKQTNVRWRVTAPFPNYGDKDAVFPPEQSLESSYDYNGEVYKTYTWTGAGVYLRHTWGDVVPSGYLGGSTNTTAYAWTYVYSPVEQDAGALIEFQNYGRSEKDQAPDKGKWDRKGSRIWLNDVELTAPAWDNTGRSIDLEKDLLNENFAGRKPYPIHLNAGWNKVFMKLPYNPDGGVRLNKWMFTFVVTDTEGRDALEGLVYDPAKRFDADYEKESSARPLVSTDTDEHWYTMKTPQRENRYASASAMTGDMEGLTEPTASSYWKFVRRSDGDLDIVNYNYGTFVSPDAAYNSALQTVLDSPKQGWTIEDAATDGLAIIVSGQSQFNQTNGSLSYKVYNWGKGVNTNDTGCQYLFTEAQSLPGRDVPDATEAMADAEALLNHTGPGYPSLTSASRQQLEAALDAVRDNATAQTISNLLNALSIYSHEEKDLVLPEEGKAYTFVNEQADGTRFPIYAKVSTLAVGSRNASAEEYGDKAVFICHRTADGKYNFVTPTGYYMIFCGKGNGYSNDKGLLKSYNAKYCDLGLGSGNSRLTGTFFVEGLRSSGKKGILIILSSGEWDAWSEGVGFSTTYSNLFHIDEAGFYDGITLPTTDATDAPLYDLQGRKVTAPARGIYIRGGKKVIYS